MDLSANNAASRAPIGLVALLAVALLINYVDQGSIAVAAPLPENELSLSASEMGWVLAAFYWAYARMQPVMGWCADRFGPARVLGGLIMVGYGWRAMFLVLGLGSLLWLVFWRRWMRSPQGTAAPAQTGGDPTHASIVHQRALWGGMMGTFCSNYAFYFVFSWLPLCLGVIHAESSAEIPAGP